MTGKELPSNAFERTVILQIEAMQRDQKRLLSVVATMDQTLSELRMRAVGRV